MRISGIDLTEITLRDALDLAILIEQEAQERYDEFAHQMEQHRTPVAAEFFRFMVRNEHRHGLVLAERRAELFGAEPTSVHRSMLWDVEAPEYDRARAYMTPREAMEAALESERKAYAFFTEALPQVTDEDVRDLFEELRREEAEHEDMVLQQIAKLPPDATLRMEDFEDEPTAQ